jgi:hypothetical protein
MSAVPSEQRDANAEIIERLARIEAGIEATNGRVTTLEEWQAEHQPKSVETRALLQSQSEMILAFEKKLDRLSVEVIRSVSATLQAMVHDAIDSVLKEDFRTMFREEAERDRLERRTERREDMKSFLTKTQKVALYVVPFLMIANFVGQWLNWW